ncbi:MAG: UPF0147 family protein [Thaumarchaeota archaeon]|nr:UPF0147 family protein [Nitrososphaerota archaeon]
MADKKEQNIEAFNNAMATLTNVANSSSTPRNIRKDITDMITGLKNEEHSISVRAANAISALDDITQDPNMPSFVRTTLWQAVSTLEGIRE